MQPCHPSSDTSTDLADTTDFAKLAPKAIAEAILGAHPPVAAVDDDEHRYSPYWDTDLDDAPLDAGAILEVVDTPTECAPHLLQYLTERGLTAVQMAATTGARPVLLQDRLTGRTYHAFRVDRIDATGLLGRHHFDFVARSGEIQKRSSSGSGASIVIALPQEQALQDRMAVLAAAKKFGIAEGPAKAAAFAMSSGIPFTCGHGVAYGDLALTTLVAICGGTLKGREVYVAADAGDVACGHSKVLAAEAALVRELREHGARVYRVQHDVPSGCTSYDANDALRDHGPDSLGAAVHNAPRVVKYRASPKRSVREGRGVELLELEAPSKQRGGGRWIIWVRQQCGQAAQRAHVLAPAHLFPQAGNVGETIATRSSLRDPDWADRKGRAVQLCGSSWRKSNDARGDITMSPRYCNIVGCVCGPRRMRGKLLRALDRIAEVERTQQRSGNRAAPLVVVFACHDLANGRQDRASAAPDQMALLAEAQTYFTEVRGTVGVDGAMMSTITEARYAFNAGSVGVVIVTRDAPGVTAQLNATGWFTFFAGEVVEAKSHFRAARFFARASWRHAPELGVDDRAHVMLGEALSPHAGTAIVGVLHGNALRRLERGLPTQGCHAHGSVDDSSDYDGPVRCPCGATLHTEGDEPHDQRRITGWSARKRHWISGPFRSQLGVWLNRTDAEGAARARAAVEFVHRLVDIASGAGRSYAQLVDDAQLRSAEANEIVESITKFLSGAVALRDGP